MLVMLFLLLLLLLEELLLEPVLLPPELLPSAELLGERLGQAGLLAGAVALKDLVVQRLVVIKLFLSLLCIGKVNAD